MHDCVSLFDALTASEADLTFATQPDATLGSERQIESSTRINIF
jgi:hypothetical protein